MIQNGKTRKKAPRRLQDEREQNTLHWRVKPEIFALLESAAMIRGCSITQLLEEGATMLAYEIIADATRAIALVRAANRRERSRKAAATRKAQKA